jgi:hypothetical protein
MTYEGIATITSSCKVEDLIGYDGKDLTYEGMRLILVSIISPSKVTKRLITKGLRLKTITR